jgi:CheY-like chemotaxis protein
MARLLVVDDEEDVRTLVELTVGGGGREVLTAVNGEEAVRLARLSHPDLILMDFLMPLMDGADACRAIKSDSETQRIPVVILTAVNREQDRERAMGAGADAYLVKPFSPLQLVSIVNRFLRPSGTEAEG